MCHINLFLKHTLPVAVWGTKKSLENFLILQNKTEKKGHFPSQHQPNRKKKIVSCPTVTVF